MGSCPVGRFVDVEQHRIKNLSSSATTWDVVRTMKPFIWPDNTSMDGKYKILLRIVIISSYLLLIGSKVMLLGAPMFLGKMIENISIFEYGIACMNAGFYVIFCFFAVILNEVRNVFYRYVQRWAVLDLSYKYVEHIFNMPYEWFIDNSPAEISHVLNRGLEASRDLTGFGVQLLVPTILEILGVSFIFIIKYDSPLTSVALIIGLLLFVVITIVITNNRIKVRKRVNDISNEMHTTISDGISNYETVKYFTNEEAELDKFKKITLKHEKYNYAIYTSLSGINSAQEFVKQLTVMGVLLIAIYYIKKQILVVGDIVAIISYLMFVFRPLYLLGTIYTSIVKSMSSLRDIINLSTQDVKIHDLPGAAELKLTDENGNFNADIVFEKVKFSYNKLVCPVTGNTEGHFRGVRNLDFTIPSGTTCAVIGTTGSGKTTISRLLCRFYDLDSGTIRINSFNVAHVTQKSLRKSIGIVPQDTTLFHASLYDNIRYGKMNATREEVFEAAKKAQLEGFIKTLPSGMDTIVGERGLKLSGGERQRVAIARCFLKNPPIIVLDEATSSLDGNTEAEVQSALISLSANRTVLVIAHRLGTIVHADQIIIMSNGQIVDRGTHESLLKNSKIYSEMWEKQTKPTNLHSIVRNQDSSLLIKTLSELRQKSDHIGPDLDPNQGNVLTCPIDDKIINSKDSLKRAPLHIAAFMGNNEIVATLIAHGANVNILAQDGMTPLHFASRKGHLDVVKTLIKHGASVKAKTAKKKETPYILAAKYKHNEVAMYLKKKTKHL